MTSNTLVLPIRCVGILTEESEEVCTPTIKNTFIHISPEMNSRAPRRQSVPPSSRLCRSEKSPMSMDSIHSDVSTDAQTEGSESGSKTPMSLDEDVSPSSEMCAQNSWL